MQETYWWTDKDIQDYLDALKKKYAQRETTYYLHQDNQGCFIFILPAVFAQSTEQADSLDFYLKKSVGASAMCGALCQLEDEKKYHEILSAIKVDVSHYLNMPNLNKSTLNEVNIKIILSAILFRKNFEFLKQKYDFKFCRLLVETLIEHDYNCQLAIQAKQLPVSQHLFDEILAQIKGLKNTTCRIIFPYNISQQHWLTGEIKLTEQSGFYTVNLFLHDPYGGGQFTQKQAKDTIAAIRKIFRLKIIVILKARLVGAKHEETVILAVQLSVKILHILCSREH